MTEELSRAQVLGYRAAALGLGDGPGGAARAAMLELGVQDTPVGSARLAMAARGLAPLEDDAGLTLAWSLRGAPHFHPAALLPGVAAALWPLNDADARVRLGWTESRHEVVSVDALSAFRLTVDALAAAVPAPMPKGEASAGVTERLPEELTSWCPRCKARHVFDTLFRQAALLAGLGMERVAGDAVVAPLAGWDGPSSPDAGALSEVVRRYLRVLGPAAEMEVASFLGSAANPLAMAWPEELVEVRVQGRHGYVAPELLEAIGAAPPPRGTFLLPPSDPYLQARDRALLLAGRRRRAAVWRPASSPGAILVDGEILGTWRHRSTPRAGFEVVLAPFDPLPEEVRPELAAAATRVAQARGEASVEVRDEDD